MMSNPLNTQSSSGKLSLSALKGKSSAQNVPSLSFRFNSASDDITEVTNNGI